MANFNAFNRDELERLLDDPLKYYACEVEEPILEREDDYCQKEIGVRYERWQIGHYGKLLLRKRPGVYEDENTCVDENRWPSIFRDVDDLFDIPSGVRKTGEREPLWPVDCI